MMSQDNVLAALKPFADAWDEYVRDGGPDGKASAEILLRPDSEFIAASNAVRDVEDIRIKEPISPEAQIRALEGALTNAKIDLRMAKARECRMQTAIRWALGELGGFPGRSEGQGAYWWRTELRERAALADSQPCKHAAELADLKTERDKMHAALRDVVSQCGGFATPEVSVWFVCQAPEELRFMIPAVKARAKAEGRIEVLRNLIVYVRNARSAAKSCTYTLAELAIYDQFIAELDRMAAKAEEAGKPEKEGGGCMA